MECPCGRTIRKKGASRCFQHGPGPSVLYAAALQELAWFDPGMAHLMARTPRDATPVGRADVRSIRRRLREVRLGITPIDVSASNGTDPDWPVDEKGRPRFFPDFK